MIRRAEISVVVPSFRGPTYRAPNRRGKRRSLSGLFDDLAAQESAPSFEVIVVSNPRDPNLESEIRVLGPAFRYLASETLGANRARNLGASAASGEIVLFLDDDCRIRDPRFLRRHLEEHRRSPDLAALGGVYELAPTASRWERAYHRQQTAWLRDPRKVSCRTDMILGGNCSFKAQILRAYPFDPKLRFGGTETELVFRLARAGLAVKLDPALCVVHDSRIGGLRGLIRKAFAQGAGASYVTEKNHRFRAFLRDAEGASHRSDERTADRWIDAVYRAAFRTGRRFGKGGTPSFARIAFLLLRTATREALGRILGFHRGSKVTEVFVAVQAALDLDSPSEP